MNEKIIELYLQFRQELDRIWLPTQIELIETKEIIVDGEIVGFLCVEDDYIDGLYILPEHRRKGLGKKAVYEWIREHRQLPGRLHIIKGNKPALMFWTSIFELQAIDENPTCVLYTIKRLKEVCQNDSQSL